jgi:hypothetical protein
MPLGRGANMGNQGAKGGQGHPIFKRLFQRSGVGLAVVAFAGDDQQQALFLVHGTAHNVNQTIVGLNQG